MNFTESYSICLIEVFFYWPLVKYPFLFLGVEGAQEVMERCEKEYPNSALFLFFKGRILRLQV